MNLASERMRFGISLSTDIPRYLLSPWLLVTSEHIKSDSASTSSSFRFPVSGDAIVLLGLALRSRCGVSCRESDDALG